MKAIAKQWGHSIGVIIPKTQVKNLGIKDGDEIEIDITPIKSPLEELFGSLPAKKNVRKEIQSFRKSMDSKWL